MAEDLFEIEPEAAPQGSKVKNRAKKATILLRLYVQPGAGRAAVAGRRGDALHVRVAPPPVDGRANVACIELLTDLLGVPGASIELVSGEHSRMKRLRIPGVEVNEVRRVLDEAVARAETRPGSPRHARANR
ncbi:MAG TPA: DUF167 domain-containing protein [Acidimicrobiales bacterium]|nr:DUF167 domain-containing protein [Acidimicrobiales bacterium]